MNNDPRTKRVQYISREPEATTELLSAMAYDIPEKEMKTATRGLLRMGFNTMYITDASKDNPDTQFGLQWGRLP